MTKTKPPAVKPFKPSARMVEALKILRDKKPKSHSYFARLYWPDNLMHKRTSNAGNHGSRRGAGAWLSAGSYLGKLKKRGLVSRNYSDSAIEYFGIATLTQAGHELLEKAEARQ